MVYKSLARLILEANPDKDITYSEMQLIWDAIIHKIYNFACACEKEAKAMEVFIYLSRDSTEAILTELQ